MANRSGRKDEPHLPPTLGADIALRRAGASNLAQLADFRIYETQGRIQPPGEISGKLIHAGWPVGFRRHLHAAATSVSDRMKKAIQPSINLPVPHHQAFAPGTATVINA
jgi:hypothetical protein